MIKNNNIDGGDHTLTKSDPPVYKSNKSVEQIQHRKNVENKRRKQRNKKARKQNTKKTNKKGRR